MDLQKLSIGQMAELNHVSEQTLRLYDKEGLLVPRCVDPVTGYRYYHIIQSAKLDLIQNMKVYGMTLRQIRSFLDSNDPAALRALLSEQAASIEERIRQLRRSQSAITRTLDNYRRYEAMPRNGEIFLEYIPERRIFRYNCDVNYFDQDESGYEHMLRQMKTNLVANNMPLSTLSRTRCFQTRSFFSSMRTTALRRWRRCPPRRISACARTNSAWKPQTSAACWTMCRHAAARSPGTTSVRSSSTSRCSILTAAACSIKHKSPCAFLVDLRSKIFLDIIVTIICIISLVRLLKN